MADEFKFRGITRAEYARHRKDLGLKGGTPASVGTALKNGRISLNEYGFIDPDVADQQWKANTSTDNYPLSARESTTPDDNVEDIPAIAISDARIKAMKAIKEELEIMELQKVLVRADDIKKDLTDVIVTLRQNIMNIPARLAPIVSPLTDITDIENAIEAELITALSGMSEMLSRSRILK